MGFFSKSSSGKHHKSGHHGSKHYQKKGLLGNLFNIIGSKSKSDDHHRNTHHHHHSDKQVQGHPAPNQSVVACHKCNAKIPAGSKFCLECGEKVNTALFCASCGEKLPPNAKFCLKCGTKLNG